MKKSRICPISDKRRVALKEEAKIRRLLLERCKGLCELCGQAPDWRGLHPHEYPFRSHGGKVSLAQSRMVCGRCHSKAHGVAEV